jgi:hypothetical protein
MTRPYTTDSLTRALVHHGARFTRSGESPRRPWTIETGIGPLNLANAECHAYVCGLADMRRGTPWLASLNRRTAIDPVDTARELADALAKAGFEALAQAILPPATYSDAARRYTVTAFDVDDVLDLRPDLTTGQAEAFLARYDSSLADSVAAGANEVLVDYLADIADEIPDPPADEILEELVEARQHARAQGLPHDPARLYWQPRETVAAACSACGACDLAGSVDPHQCQLSDAYIHVGGGSVLCTSCFAKADVARGKEA